MLRVGARLAAVLLCVALGPAAAAERRIESCAAAAAVTGPPILPAEAGCPVRRESVASAFTRTDFLDRADVATLLRTIHERTGQARAVSRPAGGVATEETTEEVWSLGVPGGDLDGDGLADVLSYDFRPADESSALGGRRGIDGHRLWTKELPDDALEIVILPAGDLDGDGRADFVLVTLAWQDRSLVVRGSTHRTWNVEAVSGADGSVVWSRRIESLETASGSPPLPVETYRYRIENALVLLAASGDHDGDGLADLVLQTLDVEVRRSAAGVGAAGAGVSYTRQSHRVSARAEVLRGADGTPLHVREQAPEPKLPFLLPGNDHVGDATRDLVWVSTDLEPDTRCLTVGFRTRGACDGLSPASDVTLIDGATFETAWSRREPGAGLEVVPGRSDLDHDGKRDLLTYDWQGHRHGFVSGAGGETLWTLGIDEGTPFELLGSVGGGPGADVGVFLAEHDPAAPAVRFDRVDGKTGMLLSSTLHPFAAEPGENGSPYALPAGDGDGDGAEDLLIGAYFHDSETGAERYATRVVSAASAAILATRDSVGSELTVPVAGDLDGDGRDDVIAIRVDPTDENDVRIVLTAIQVPGSAELWTRSDPFSGAEIVAMPDASGLGGADLLYNQLLLELGAEGFLPRSRFDLLEGKDGLLRWGS